MHFFLLLKGSFLPWHFVHCGLFGFQASLGWAIFRAGNFPPTVACRSWGESVRFSALCQTTERKLFQKESANWIIKQELCIFCISSLNVYLVRGWEKKTQHARVNRSTCLSAKFTRFKNKDFTQMQRESRKSTSTKHTKYFGQNQPHLLFSFTGYSVEQDG